MRIWRKKLHETLCSTDVCSQLQSGVKVRRESRMEHTPAPPPKPTGPAPIASMTWDMEATERLYAMFGAAAEAVREGTPVHIGVDLGTDEGTVIQTQTGRLRRSATSVEQHSSREFLQSIPLDVTQMRRVDVAAGERFMEEVARQELNRLGDRLASQMEESLRNLIVRSGTATQRPVGIMNSLAMQAAGMDLGSIERRMAALYGANMGGESRTYRVIPYSSPYPAGVRTARTAPRPGRITADRPNHRRRVSAIPTTSPGDGDCSSQCTPLMTALMRRAGCIPNSEV